MKTLPALGIAFIVLKLCEVIAWSWWWVLAPFWIPFIFVSIKGMVKARLTNMEAEKLKKEVSKLKTGEGEWRNDK